MQTDIGISEMGIGLPVPDAMGRVCRILWAWVYRMPISIT